MNVLNIHLLIVAHALGACLITHLVGQVTMSLEYFDDGPDWTFVFRVLIWPVDLDRRMPELFQIILLLEALNRIYQVLDTGGSLSTAHSARALRHGARHGLS